MASITAIAAAAAFNLVCSGTLTSSSFVGGEKSEPFTYIYRLDIDRKIYCDGDCKATRPIEAIQPTQIMLSSSNVDTPSERATSFTMIDRETGAFQSSSTSSQRGDRRTILVMKWTGQCEKAAFTGFPKFDTKF